MQAAAFLQTNRRPTDSQIKEALAGNLCRCGTHTRIVRCREARFRSDGMRRRPC